MYTRTLDNKNNTRGCVVSLHTTGLAAGPGRRRVRIMLRRRAGLVGNVGRVNCSMVQAMAAEKPVNKMAGH